MRGVAVYANARLVNEPESFGASDSSYAYAYLTGYIAVDGLDAIKPDVVATDRRAVNWDQPDAASWRERSGSHSAPRCHTNQWRASSRSG